MVGDVWGNSWGSSWGSSWAQAQEPAPPVIVQTNQSGVRRARFLRRRLPWEIEDEPEQVVTVTEKKPKRIRLPKEVVRTVKESIPVQAVEIPRLLVSIPDIPVVYDDDDDDLLLMI